MNIQLELDDQQSQRLTEVATRLNVSAVDLARAAVADLLSQSDDDFRAAAEHVLTKNADLYDRLS